MAKQEKQKQTTEEINLEEMTKEQLIDLVNFYKKQQEDSKPSEDALSEARASAEDYKDKWLRLAAEFENYKKRNAKIRLESMEEGRGEIAVKLLPIGDNLDRALKMNIDENTLSGLNMLKKSFDDTVKAVGLCEIATAGDVFDPALHEAVMQVPTEDEGLDDKIAEVYLQGYKLGERVVRYAQVSVYKA